MYKIIFSAYTVVWKNEYEKINNIQAHSSKIRYDCLRELENKVKKNNIEWIKDDAKIIDNFYKKDFDKLLTEFNNG